jgi:hypothetical protein
MNASLVACLVLGSALTACGAFALAWRPRGDRLVALPLLAAGSCVCLAGVSRFAALRQDPLTGQELAALVSLTALVSTVLAVGWAVRETTPRR